MPSAALKMCNKPGCNVLVKRGYCDAHATKKRDGFRELDKKKTPETIKFYHSRKWTETSKRHRRAYPLCARCKAAGRVVAGDMVHHNPPFERLIKNGLNPYDSQYLETLCNSHHLEDLRFKRRATRTDREI